MIQPTLFKSSGGKSKRVEVVITYISHIFCRCTLEGMYSSQAPCIRHCANSSCYRQLKLENKSGKPKLNEVRLLYHLKNHRSGCRTKEDIYYPSKPKYLWEQSTKVNG